MENSGFIIATAEFSHKKKETRYRLIDEYSLFYLTWIKPAIGSKINHVSQNYWQSIQNSPAYFSWAGYVFEGICLKHVDKIIESLKISVVARSCSVWSYRPIKEDAQKGAQIDLVIDRADNCINLCEIKFSNSAFLVNKSYAENLRYKKSCFQEQTKTKKSVFLTVITCYGATVNQHYLSSVDNQLTMDSFF